jgi:ribosomal protein S18 acetylase RimI-like enzyme
MEVAISIVKAEEKHLYAIAAMTAHYFPYTQFTYTAIKTRLANPAIVYFAAIEDGHCVGFLDYELKEDRAQVLGLAVLEESRRKGIAAALLEHAIAQIKAAGKARVDLLVAADNDAAKALYQKFGFSHTGKLERQIWGKEVDVYSKKL